MGREISLFADFKQAENSCTNYCGLILKLLYRENPQSFEEVIVSLLPPDTQIAVGPSFTQQTKKARSIPDLAIQQHSFNIFFETKLDDWFYSDQLQRHVEGLAHGAQLSVLFLLCTEFSQTATWYEQESAKARAAGVILQRVTFEDFLQALQKVRASTSFAETLDEFADYLDRTDRLPRWKNLLVVVNCFSTMNEIRLGAYICPDTGGAYSHQRARYLGPYKDKTVATTHEVLAVVGVEAGMATGRVKWNPSRQNDTTLVAQAIHILSQTAPWRLQSATNTPHQVFLLGPAQPTDFAKDSSGGMGQSKIYFWDIAKTLGAQDAPALAHALNGRKWSEFGR